MPLALCGNPYSFYLVVVLFVCGAFSFTNAYTLAYTMHIMSLSVPSSYLQSLDSRPAKV